MYKTGQTDKHLMTKLINESKTVTHDLKKFGIVCEQKEILAINRLSKPNTSKSRKNEA